MADPGSDGTSNAKASRIPGGQSGRVVGKLSILHDLYIELLGSLVPGLFTVIVGGTALLLALSTLHNFSLGSPMMPNGFSQWIGPVVGGIHWEFSTVILVSAYIIGAVFFRQDPKRPDTASALYNWIRSSNDERRGLAVQGSPSQDQMPYLQRWLAYVFAKHYSKKLGLDTQFPYPHLRCYLKTRGLTHLSPLVPWCPEKQETKGYRSKMFINLFKVRLLACFPEMSREIIRNEAHVRLATSLWYACGCLKWMALILLPVILPTFLKSEMRSTSFLSTAFTGLLLGFCLVMRYQLRKCIHYMRVREVVYVLETGYLAQKTTGGDLFEDLTQREKDGICDQCSNVPS